ncbi:MAG: TRAP transporter substrate-binding protein [Pseudomonadota bacterium]|nr:TRAP transporter substrate-binding protein [Pseudomonadota bacterium]
MKRFFCLTLAFLASCSNEPPSGNVTESETGPSQATFQWKLITTWPKNFPALGTAPERLAELVDEMSAGRLRIKVYGGGELVPEMEVFDAVSAGTAEMGHGAAYYWRGKVPIGQIFATVPFGMTAQEMNGWLHHGGGMELWRELYEPFGLVPLAAGNSGVQMAGWFNREIRSLEDIRGLKMRIPGLGGAVFRQAGGIAVAMPGSEMYTSMQTGVIDATEWVGPYNDLAFGLHEVGKYYYYPGWHEPGTTLEAIVNVDAWRLLPTDLQAILEIATRAINQDVLDEFTARNNAALKILVDEHGVELRRLPDDVIREFAEISQELIAETAGDDPLSNRILKSYTDFAENVREYHAISEQAYINARDIK